MELIPILSTIILVATISTFILAIGAYVLYKVREARGQQVSVPAPSTVKAELITPGEAPSPLVYEQPRMSPKPIYMEQPQSIQYQPSVQPIFSQSQQFTTSPRQFSEPGYSELRSFQNPSPAPVPAPAPAPRQRAEAKFMKYTEDGYVSASESKEEKSNGALRWK